MRNKTKFAYFVQKRMNTNPGRGPFHFRSPARIFWRTVRGMLPHKTSRGQNALLRLSAFEGIPDNYQKVKRVVVPAALKVIRMRPDRNYTVIGDLSREVGWGYQELVAKLETQRKAKEQEYYKEKKSRIATKGKAVRKADTKAVDATLASFGY